MRMSAALRVIGNSPIVQFTLTQINGLRKQFGNAPLLNDKNLKDKRTKAEKKKEKMNILKKEKLRMIQDEKQDALNRKRTAIDMKGQTVRSGSMVKARWRNGKTYYTGYLSQINTDGTMNILYDDGENFFCCYRHSDLY